MKRVTKVTGIVIGVGAAVAAVAWMLRDRIARPKTAEAPQPVPAFRVTPPATPARTDADDLALIHGIGPVFKARLATAGISRFDELASTEVGRVAQVAGVTESRAAEWIDLARSLV